MNSRCHGRRNTTEGNDVHGRPPADPQEQFHAAVRAAANRALDGYVGLPDGPCRQWAWQLLADLTDACHALDETVELNRLMELPAADERA
jgi:hypothetical protein